MCRLHLLISADISLHEVYVYRSHVKLVAPPSQQKLEPNHALTNIPGFSLVTRLQLFKRFIALCS